MGAVDLGDGTLDQVVDDIDMDDEEEEEEDRSEDDEEEL